MDDTRFMNEVFALWFERDPAIRRDGFASGSEVGAVG